MDDPLRVIAEAEGVFLRREALGCGYTDKLIRSRMRSGAWHRVRHGAYCFWDQWAPLKPEQRHLLLAKAVLRTTPGPVALSHTTALIAHGVAVWGADLRRVHVTRLDDGAARVEHDVIHHVGRLAAGEVVEQDRLPVVGAARAVVEAASILSTESALVSADSSLFRKHCTPDDLHAVARACNHWPGSQKIHVVLHRMDGRHESPGESRSDYLFWRHGLPRPEPQWKVYDHRGILVAALDFAWPALGVWGEFDGRVKYGRLLREGQEPGDAVFEEKQREDRVRALTGWLCGRIVHVDLDNPALTAGRFQMLFARAAAARAAIGA
ncbi:MAG TPA: type IV toxin-antitoxin system AbiEi family antitoxin domain-containing protein [Marmoricola sp.]